MNMTTTRTARPARRAWPVVVLIALAAVAVVVFIAVTAYAVGRDGGTDRPAPVVTVTEPDGTRTPGDGLPCPIHQPC